MYEKYWNAEHSTFYYYNKESEASSWELPAEDHIKIKVIDKTTKEDKQAIKEKADKASHQARAEKIRLLQ